MTGTTPMTRLIGRLAGFGRDELAIIYQAMTQNRPDAGLPRNLLQIAVSYELLRAQKKAAPLSSPTPQEIESHVA